MESFDTEKFNLRYTHRIPRFGLPFYYTWEDFANNYPKNLTTFINKSPYNNEELLKRQFLGLYTYFFYKEGNGYNYEVIQAVSETEKGKQANYYATIEDYSKFLFQNKGDLNIFSRFNKFKPLEKQIKPEKTITIYFTEFVDRVMMAFFQEEASNMYNHKILIDKYLFFTKNVEKIVMFLQSDKTFKEWTTPEPHPAPVVSDTEPQPENPKQSKTILINGRTPNLLERYLIADKTLNLEKSLRTLNVSEKERYKLLALVLGCNEDNARRVMSGTYPAKTNQKEIDDFANKYLSE